MKKYIAPEVEVMSFNAEDVITTSGGYNGLLSVLGTGEVTSAGSSSGFLFTNGDLSLNNDIYGE